MTTNSHTTTIRERRRRLGLTQIELSSRAGCSLGMLANIERGAIPRKSRVITEIEATLENLEKHAAAAA